MSHRSGAGAPAGGVERGMQRQRGIGRSSAYQAVRTGEWPTRVVRVGRCIRIPTAEVLRLLGLDTKEYDA